MSESFSKLRIKVEKSTYPIPWTELVLEPGNYIIGRSPYAHVVIPDKLASRRHARVFFSNGRWYIEDLGSKNGTILDGTDIRNLGPVELKDKHELIIGITILKLEVLKPQAGEGKSEGGGEKSGGS